MKQNISVNSDRQLLILAISVAMLSFVLSACGASGSQRMESPEAITPGENVAWPTLSFPIDHNWPATTHVTADAPYDFSPEDVLYSENMVYTGEAFQLTPAPASKALFGVNTGNTVPAQMTISGTFNQLFIGLANYSEQRWEWRGPYDSSQTINLLTGRYQSPTGGVYLALATVAPGQAEVSVTLDTTPGDYSGTWNVLYWLAADNYLAPAAYELIQGLEAVGSTAEIKILAGVDINPGYLEPAQLGAEQVRFIKVVKDADESGLNSAGDPANQAFPRAGFDSSDPAALATFVEWAQTNFPADHTALVLFGFGDGWRSAGTDDEREPSAHSSSGVLADYFDGSVVISSHQELAETLKDYHFDLIMLDASSGGQLEALYEYRNLADWAVASQITVPAAGYPYQDWLTAWQGAFPLPAGAVGWQFVEAVNGRYGSQDLPWFTNNLYNLDQAGPLAGALRDLQTTCDIWPTILKPELAQAVVDSRSGGRTSSGSLDLRLFLENFKSGASVVNARQDCDAALLALDRFATFGRRSATLAISGVSVYLPATEWHTAELQAEYATLDFNEDAAWLDWLSGLELPASITVRDWHPGWRLMVDYEQLGADAELEVFDPADHYGRPTYTSEVENIVEFSADNLAASGTTEWAELLATGSTGVYAFDVHYRGASPDSLSLTAWLEDESGTQIQSFGTFTVESGKRVNLVALRLVDYGESAGYITPGDRIELLWSDPTLHCELRVRNPWLEYGGVSFPEGYAGTMVFGPLASTSGILAEWGRLSDTAPLGAYQLLAYVHDVNTGMPSSGSAEVHLMQFNSAGGVKHDLGVFTLRTSDAGSGTVILKPLAVLLNTL